MYFLRVSRSGREVLVPYSKDSDLYCYLIITGYCCQDSLEKMYMTLTRLFCFRLNGSNQATRINRRVEVMGNMIEADRKLIARMIDQWIRHPPPGNPIPDPCPSNVILLKASRDDYHSKKDKFLGNKSPS